MQPKLLRHDTTSLEDLWYVLLYTEARLSYEANAKDFTEEATKLVDRAEQIRLGQLKVWRKEVITQALVDICNEALDALTRSFEKQLYRFLEDEGIKDPTKDPRYRAYFPEALSKTINLGLETQVQKTRHFPAALRKESSAVLQAFSARFEAEFSKADAAVKALKDAQAERRSHRVHEIVQLFEDANTGRQNLYGKLTSRAAEQKLGRDWAENFFRRGESTSEDPRDLKRRAIFLTLSARSIELSKENRQRINNEDNDTVLDGWLAKAGVVIEQGALFW